MSNFSKLVVPSAIIIAGALVAWAIFHSGGQPKAAVPIEDAQKKAADYVASLDIAPVTEADHIRGSVNAKVMIVEYSDTECPFCKQFHQTLSQIFDNYNPSVASSTTRNQVAWVYRHFPIADLHSKAPKEAEATECASELGGTEIFWKYLSAIFTNTPSNDGLDPAQLPVFADNVGLDKKAFTACLNSGKYAAKINESVAAGIRAGATATPYTVILVRTGATNGISGIGGTGGKIERVPLIDPAGGSLGALPYATLKAIVERLLNS